MSHFWFLKKNSHSLFGRKQYTMQLRRSLFRIFPFIILQTAAFPAFIMWKTPLFGVDFLCEQKGVRPGPDHRKGLGPSWSYRQYCCTVPPCESDLWPAEGVLSSRMVFSSLAGAVLSEAFYMEAKRGLDFHLSHCQLTVNDFKSHNLNGSTSSTRLLS